MLMRDWGDEYLEQIVERRQSQQPVAVE
jgi:hypothetical protein